MSVLRILGVFTHQARLLRHKLHHCVLKWHWWVFQEMGMEVEQRAHMTKLKFHLSRGAFSVARSLAAMCNLATVVSLILHLERCQQRPCFASENQRRDTILEPSANVEWLQIC